MELLNIGSVITVNKVDLVILGYSIRVLEGDKYGFYYNVGLFPVGVIPGRDSVGCIAVDHEYELKFEGFSDPVQQKYKEMVEGRMDAFGQHKPSEVNAVLELALEKIKEMTNK